MPRAWSWSVAITSPPPSGWVRRISVEPGRRPARSTVGSHSPSSESAVRSRWLDRACVERVVERRRVERAVGRGPLHVAVDAGEVDGPHDPPVGQRLAVAVLVVGRGLVELVADERDRPGVAAERRARQASRRAARLEGEPHRRRPRPARRRRGGSRRRSTNAPSASRRSTAALRRHLLVGGDDAVHVRRADRRRSAAQAGSRWRANRAAAGAHCTLRWAVGATTTSRRAGRSAEHVAGRGEGERRLAGAGRGHGEEVGPVAAPGTARAQPSARVGGGPCCSTGRPSGDGDVRSARGRTPMSTRAGRGRRCAPGALALRLVHGTAESGTAVHGVRT